MKTKLPIFVIDFNPEPNSVIDQAEGLLKEFSPTAIIVETLSTGQIHEKVVAWLKEEISKRRKEGDQTPFIMLPRDRETSDYGLTPVDGSKEYGKGEEAGLVPLGGANYDKHFVNVRDAVIELSNIGITGDLLAEELKKRFPGEARTRDREGMLHAIRSKEPEEYEQFKKPAPEF